MNKILITGGCGMLGSNLAAHAIKLGYDVCIIDNLSKNGSLENLNWIYSLGGKVTFYAADIKYYNEVYDIISFFMPDIIFHVAGQVAMTTSLRNPMHDFAVNAIGSMNILESVRVLCPDTCILYASTNKVYGDFEHLEYVETDTRYYPKQYSQGFDETMPIDCHTPYGCSKGTADMYFQDYARIFGLKTVVFRHSTIYGIRQFATYDQGWIGWFCKKAIEVKKGKLKEQITVSGTGKQVRDILYVSDAVNLYFNCVENITEVAGKAFNVGGGISNSLSLIELFLLLERHLNIKMIYKTLPERANDQKFFVADYSMLHDLVSWTPQVSKEEGLKMIINTACENLLA